MSGARPRPIGALAVLAIGFLISAGLRTGDVIAALPDDGFATPIATDRQTQSSPEEADAPSALVAELRQQRQRLAEREAALDERAQTLEAIEARLRTRLSQLEAAQRRLAETAALVDDAAGRDIRHLAKMYQQMKPKQAGAIFDRMAPSFAAGFLAEMRPDAAALIMANMSAEKAYAVSLLLAGRNVGRKPDE